MILAAVNHKGGVGKTTTVANLGFILAERGYETLMIDFDPQADLSRQYGVQTRYSLALVYDEYENDKEPTVEWQDISTHLRLVSSGISLATLEKMLSKELMGGERFLKRVIETYCERNGTPDFILIDCPPTLSHLTVNAIVAAEAILIVSQTEMLSLSKIDELRALARKITKATGKAVWELGIVGTMYDGRINSHQVILEQMRSQYGDLVFKSVIPRNAAVSEATIARKPLVGHRRGSPASLAYQNLVEEIESRIKAEATL